VPKFFNIEHGSDFRIAEIDSGFIIAREVVHERVKNEFVVTGKGFFSQYSPTLFNREDSIVDVDEGLFSKYKISFSDSLITYSPGIFKTIIHKSNDGYFLDEFLSKKCYKLTDSAVYIGNKYIFRHSGTQIDILSPGWGNKEHPIFSIIHSDNCIYVNNKYRRGFEICQSHNKIHLKKSNRKGYTYFLQ
jgi:hypothetical protein